MMHISTPVRPRNYSTPIHRSLHVRRAGFLEPHEGCHLPSPHRSSLRCFITYERYRQDCTFSHILSDSLARSSKAMAARRSVPLLVLSALLILIGFGASPTLAKETQELNQLDYLPVVSSRAGITRQPRGATRLTPLRGSAGHSTRD